ncbi:hypothetical protein F0L68_15130 [Solihabitans fulvus]|uniref:Signal transduction histidine kinase osmosensitive K+ channel sensor N-terminal domain-containing protein n=1 Tax=Solihabitans fulvus TaxID=1892852 RepID=A0A5B2XFK1_9PSEU|nr:hypothetical protein F0L68_15130 [Solihabitans fulvus]
MSRGQLRIYLGHQCLARGTNVVIGVVEQHEQRLTETMADGLEVMPVSACPRGRVFEEMDLDALLALRPQVVLVDEFAHRRARPAARDERWQEVEDGRLRVVEADASCECGSPRRRAGAAVPAGITPRGQSRDVGVATRRHLRSLSVSQQDSSGKEGRCSSGPDLCEHGTGLWPQGPGSQW